MYLIDIVAYLRFKKKLDLLLEFYLDISIYGKEECEEVERNTLTNPDSKDTRKGRVMC